MKIVEPYAKMLDPMLVGGVFEPLDGVEMLKRIEYYARVSHASEDKITEDSYDRFMRSVIGHGDWSVTEHEKVTCEFLVDRGVGYEIVRHRIRHGWIDEPLIGDPAFTQESTRFINYKKAGGEAKFIRAPGLDAVCEALWYESLKTAEESYMRMCADGVKPQIARSVLPNALASKIIVTYNLRTWRHFFVMRTCAQAHPQMRQVVDPLLAEFKSKIPILYEDIVPGEQQSKAMGRPR